jgi:hypothetical protein
MRGKSRPGADVGGTRNARKEMSLGFLTLQDATSPTGSDEVVISFRGMRAMMLQNKPVKSVDTIRGHSTVERGMAGPSTLRERGVGVF